MLSRLKLSTPWGRWLVGSTGIFIVRSFFVTPVHVHLHFSVVCHAEQWLWIYYQSRELLIEGLLCARHCARHWGLSWEWREPALGAYIPVGREMSKNPTTNIILNSKRLNAFSWDCHHGEGVHFHRAIQHHIGNPKQGNRARKRNMMYHTERKKLNYSY